MSALDEALRAVHGMRESAMPPTNREVTLHQARIDAGILECIQNSRPTHIVRCYKGTLAGWPDDEGLFTEGWRSCSMPVAISYNKKGLLLVGDTIASQMQQRSGGAARMQFHLSVVPDLERDTHVVVAYRLGVR